MSHREYLKTVRGLMEWLSQQIHRGHYPPGSQMPAERKLASELGVNRSTVAAAYQNLEMMGLLDRRRGSGTFVHSDLWGVMPDWEKYLKES